MPEAEEKDNISIMRKRLVFRSWHRGTREMDLMLGRFAEDCLPHMSENELQLYDEFLSESDPDIFNWVSGYEAVPEQNRNPVVEKLLAFYAASTIGT